MGRLMILAVLTLVAGCNREASFDERYAKAETDIRAKAKDIDAEIAVREREASAAAATPSGSIEDQAASVMNAAK